jgi:hypothetical protein
VAGRRLSGTAEQKVGIFCLPGVVEDSGQICFSRGSQPRFFLHVRVLRKSMDFLPAGSLLGSSQV